MVKSTPTTPSTTTPTTTATTEAKATAAQRTVAWTAELRTQLLEYYFEKHTLSSAELAEIADRLGKKKMHCYLQFRRIIKPRALKAQE